MSKMSLKSSMRLKKRRKAGDPWVSTNRVLNGLGKKPGNFGRNPNFDTDETRLLIQLWGEPKVQRALITTHKKHAVIAQLAQKMQDYGYFRSPEEITTRIKNLKCFYNRIKKDEESSGEANPAKPGWKHFTEMDAIMTRPIFSVRPNEIPAPSLKYRLEQAREERAERRKLKLTAGTLASDPITDDSDDFMEDDDSMDLEERDATLDDGIIPDVEVDIDINDATFAAMTKSQTNGDMAGEPQIKNEKSQSPEGEEPKKENENVTSTDPLLLEPKQEPIDVDAEDTMDASNTEDKFDNHEKEENTKTTTPAYVQQLIPTVADILAKEKNVTMTMSTGGQLLMPISSSATVVVSSTSTPSSSSSLTTTTTISRASTPITASATTTTTLNNMTGKISLVPTNFLMQPGKNITTRVVTSSSGGVTKTQGQQIHLLQSTPQQRILFSGATNAQSGSNNSTNTGIMTTGPGGMKVLLLSAEQAAAAAAGNTTLTGVGNFSKTLGTFMPLNANMLMQTQKPSMTTLPQQQIHISNNKSSTATTTTTFSQPMKTLNMPQQVSSSSSSSSSSATSTFGVNMNSPKAPTIVHQLVNDEAKHATRSFSRKKIYKQPQQGDKPIADQPFQQQPQQQQQQQEHPYQHQQQQQQQQEPLTKRDATNLRILLRQLLNAQFESNAINSRRWKLERDRFEFEKSISERFFEAIPSFLDTLKETFKPMAQQQQPPPPQQPHHQQPSQTPNMAQPAQPIFQATPFMTVTSAAASGGHLRLQPPKLLFTAVRHPTLYNAPNTISLAPPALGSVLTNANVVPSDMVTTSQATTTTTSDNDTQQLLIPKNEPQDN